VTEKLKDLNMEVEAKEEVTEQATHEPISPLTKHQFPLKVKNITKIESRVVATSEGV
jgi:hypothetical protein